MHTALTTSQPSAWRTPPGGEWAAGLRPVRSRRRGGGTRQGSSLVVRLLGRDLGRTGTARRPVAWPYLCHDVRPYYGKGPRCRLSTVVSLMTSFWDARFENGKQPSNSGGLKFISLPVIVTVTPNLNWSFYYLMFEPPLSDRGCPSFVGGVYL